MAGADGQRADRFGGGQHAADLHAVDSSARSRIGDEIERARIQRDTCRVCDPVGEIDGRGAGVGRCCQVATSPPD